MTSEPLRPGDKVDSDASTRSTSAELVLRKTRMEYPFEVTSAPAMNRLPQDWGGKPVMVVPRSITIVVERLLSQDGAVEVKATATDIYGHRVLKSGAVSDVALMEVRLGYTRSEWPEWILNLVDKFESGELS